MSRISLDHVVIASSDFAVSDEFYARVLGAEVLVPHENFRFYRIGAQQLNVHGKFLPPPPNTALVARDPVRPGNSDVCFEWRGSVEDAIRYLKDKGVEPETGAVNTAGAKGKGVSVYFRDPDGSLLEFITYPD